MSAFFDRLLSETTFGVLVPAAILFCVFVLLALVLWRAQMREDFDIAQFLQDDHGKYSALRAWGFICLGIHSWWVATLVFRGEANENYFLYYGIIWAGTPVMMKFAERWTGALPLTQPSQPPHQG